MRRHPRELICRGARLIILLAMFMVGGAGRVTTAAVVLPEFDFAEPASASGWVAAHDVAELTRTAEGLVARISGPDPYIIGPPRNYPSGIQLWLRLRLRSEQCGMCQVFYSNTGFTEGQSVRFDVPAGRWHEAKVRLPALGAGYRMRIDPPGNGGVCVLGWLRFEQRVLVQAPKWPVPSAPSIGTNALAVRSGDIELQHGRQALGQFVVHVDGHMMCTGNTNGLIGYLVGNTAKWFEFGPGTNGSISVSVTGVAGGQTEGSAIRAEAVTVDPDNARWRIEQVFSPMAPGAIRVTTSVTVDRDRDVVYLPMLTILPGLGSFGTNKVQALLAGVEYLENEPSSSTADLNPPASNRQVPDTAKITFPLMALAAEGRFVGMSWRPDRGAPFCAVFDSPDRMFGCVGHLMGLLFPGSGGNDREENSLIPYDSVRVGADRALGIEAVLMGGPGDTVVPAIQQYVRLFGLPPLPQPGMSATEFLALTGHGWLESALRDGDRYRHAAPGFNSGPASDAALYMDYAARFLNDPGLTDRLAAAARSALLQVTSANYNASQVGHVRYPVPSLVYGAAADNAARSAAHAQNLLKRFESDGSVIYKPPPSGPDYSSTHWSKEANGFAATYVHALLEEASFAGNRALIEAGLNQLTALNKFRNTVPRGAQTWEIPLHTPDILASAYLVRAYLRGFELTGDRSLLDQARYWAWTGVPFVYLTPPASQPVGLYSTIPVLGATAWVAPVWIGLPVQWCGLVYAEALQRLAFHDLTGPWKQIADGITVSGIQQTYPMSDTNYLGLLPDSFSLRTQTRNLAAINPATTLAPALRTLGLPAVYEFRPFRAFGLFAHAPGSITDVSEHSDGLRFTVTGWSSRPYWLLVNGFTTAPSVRLNGTKVGLSPPHQFQSADGRLILRLEGQTVVELAYPALAAVSVELLPPDHALRISWPKSATGFVLQASQHLASDLWAPVTNPILPDGNRLFTVETALDSQRFYRLAR